jgi:hypothetical protein
MKARPLRSLPLLPYRPIQPVEIPAARQSMRAVAAYLLAAQSRRQPGGAAQPAKP